MLLTITQFSAPFAAAFCTHTHIPLALIFKSSFFSRKIGLASSGAIKVGRKSLKEGKEKKRKSQEKHSRVKSSSRLSLSSSSDHRSPSPMPERFRKGSDFEPIDSAESDEEEEGEMSPPRKMKAPHSPRASPFSLNLSQNPSPAPSPRSRAFSLSSFAKKFGGAISKALSPRTSPRRSGRSLLLSFISFSFY